MSTPVTVAVTTRKGLGYASCTLNIEGHMVSDMGEPDTSGLLFAMEFAINNHASGIFGHAVRCHILEGQSNPIKGES